MKLQILAVGRARKGAGLALWDDYSKRVGRFGPGLGFRSLSLREFGESTKSRPKERMASEADILLEAAAGTEMIVLDEHGSDMRSADFANLLAHWRDDGVTTAAFVIGGPDGLDGRVLNSAARRIRFGQQTWPHLLVRAMLAEQLYRAMTILAGHPYHRE